MRPRLSILVPGLLGYDRISGALAAWDAQTRRDAFEIIVLSPEQVPAEQLTRNHRVVVVGNAYLQEARVQGIAEAKADFIVLAEDHCLPDPEWVQSILPHLDEGWAAIGPALRSGNPKTAICQASFVLGYGQWMAPIDSGPTGILPGHNVVLRKSDLLELGAELKDLITVSSFLVQRLKQMGKKFYLEHLATMRHFDIPHWRRTLRIFFYVGLGFGAQRTASWPIPAKLFYFLAVPAIGFKHLSRGLKAYWKSGHSAGIRPLAIFAMAVLSACWAIGEGLGAILGRKRTAHVASITELKPVSSQELAAIDTKIVRAF